MDDIKSGPAQMRTSVNEESQVKDEEPSTPSLKHEKNGVVLVPRPSDDPRDPLVCSNPSFFEASPPRRTVRLNHHDIRIGPCTRKLQLSRSWV